MKPGEIVLITEIGYSGLVGKVLPNYCGENVHLVHVPERACYIHVMDKDMISESSLDTVEFNILRYIARSENRSIQGSRLPGIEAEKIHQAINDANVRLNSNRPYDEYLKPLFKRDLIEVRNGRYRLKR